MTLIETLWLTIANSTASKGVFRLLDESHPLDLYAGFDQDNRRVLMLVTQFPPEELPATGAVEVTVNLRSDGDYAVLFRLARTELNELFGRLCQDLIDSTRASKKELGAAALLQRLIRWRRLLESGRSGLSESQLRGLYGELWFLWTIAIPVHGAVNAINGWNGPLGAPQDFQLGPGLVEVKAILPGIHSVSISSAEQLEHGSSSLQLVVVSLHPSEELSLPSLIANIRQELEASLGCISEFELRLAEAGYSDRLEYERVKFSVDQIRFYPVGETFPRIASSQIPSGISRLTYDLDLHQCGEYRSEYIHEHL
jgi:hypothetical protein